jgi:hypothetical protein
LRAGSGAAEIRFHGHDAEVLANTTGFEIVHRAAVRPTPWKER